MAPRNGRPGYISSISRNARRANSPAPIYAIIPAGLFYPDSRWIFDVVAIRRSAAATDLEERREEGWDK